MSRNMSEGSIIFYKRVFYKTVLITSASVDCQSLRKQCRHRSDPVIKVCIDLVLPLLKMDLRVWRIADRVDKPKLKQKHQQKKKKKKNGLDI